MPNIIKKAPPPGAEALYIVNPAGVTHQITPEIWEDTPILDATGKPMLDSKGKPRVVKDGFHRRDDARLAMQHEIVAWWEEQGLPCPADAKQPDRYLPKVAAVEAELRAQGVYVPGSEPTLPSSGKGNGKSNAKGETSKPPAPDVNPQPPASPTPDKANVTPATLPSSGKA